MLKFLLALLATGFLFMGTTAHANYDVNNGAGKKKSAYNPGTKKKTVSRAKKSVKKVSAKKKVVKKTVAKKTTTKKTKKVAIVLDEFSRNKGSFMLPLEDASIKTGFGPYKVGLGTVTGNNPGLTLEAVPGSSVKSVFNGIVTMLFNIEGALGVIVRHGSYITVYSNLASVNVAMNDVLSSGDIIGKAANNQEGNAELEFLLMKKNQNIDPEPWIRKNK